MITRKHPTFHKQMMLFILSGIFISGALLVNCILFEGKNILAGHIGLLLIAMVSFGTVTYGFWAGRHVEGPECFCPCQPIQMNWEKEEK